MIRSLSMIACGLSLPTLLYLLLAGAGSKITPEPDGWLQTFRQVQAEAQLHSTSRDFKRHYLDKRIRELVNEGVFPGVRLRSYRVAETPVQVVTFPPDVPLDHLVEDGADEYKNEKFRTRHFRVCRSGRHLLVIRTRTTGSPVGRHKVPKKVLRNIVNAFRKEAGQRGHSKN